MICAGIDGSKGGWISVIRVNNRFQVFNVRKIDQLFELPITFDLALVDMPLGLGSSHVIREVERFARKKLSPNRHSSVFNPPVREAIEQTTYEKASETNREITGKKITRQSWNIVSRIKETDHLLRKTPNLMGRLLEAHPEICFKYLNHGKIPVNRKREPGHKGAEERVNILKNYFEEAEPFYYQERKLLNSSVARPDDLIDALCLCVTACMGAQYKLNSLQNPPVRDDFNIEMNMHYFNPNIMTKAPSTPG